MRNALLWLAIACKGSKDGPPPVGDPGATPPPGPTGSTTADTGSPPRPPGVEICDPLKGLTVLSATLSQPWSEHEAQVDVTLSAPAAVAVACTLQGDDREVHLVEGESEATEHALRLAGLLAASSYTCQVAPVCPSSTAPAFEVELKTGAPSNPLLPQIVLQVHESGASNDYVVTNHQNSGAWNGQRRMVIDRDAHVRWHAVAGAGGGAGGSAFGFSPATQTFTIGGGWPPNNNGRPQRLDLYGSGVLYDTLPVLPDSASLLFHHEARQLSDGRLLTLEEPVIHETDGGTFNGFGVHIVDPETDTVDFAWTSQVAYDIGEMPGGGGDVYHANWADVVNDVLHVSLCVRKTIVAIDVATGAWVWEFGAGGDFSLVDADGAPLPDSEFPQCQHGVQRRGDNLLVYDNGQIRGFSRAVEYSLDEVNLVATKLWDWTEPGWYETSLGGVDYTSGGGALVAMGHIEIATPSPGDHTTFVEIDPSTGEKLWEIRYANVNDMAYRAQSVAPCELFANAKYCSWTQDRLAELAPIF